MLHLSTERLAALADEHATADESAHLAACAACAREHDAYRALVAMAGAERTAFGLPLTRWDTIASALEAGAGSGDHADVTPRRTLRIASRWPLRAAAGLLLLAGGAVLGRATAGADVIPGTPSASTSTIQVVADPGARLMAESAFSSIEDARAAQRRSEQLYQQAVAYLAQYDSTAVDDGSPVAYKSRLAALDRVISATGEAMREAPHDPVINGYYLTTLGQREATIRQLNTALPASLRLDSF